MTRPIDDLISDVMRSVFEALPRDQADATAAAIVAVDRFVAVVPWRVRDAVLAEAVRFHLAVKACDQRDERELVAGIVTARRVRAFCARAEGGPIE